MRWRDKLELGLKANRASLTVARVGSDRAPVSGGVAFTVVGAGLLLKAKR
jgi:hypothetical protein